jgi:hypothetical protein
MIIFSPFIFFPPTKKEVTSHHPRKESSLPSLPTSVSSSQSRTRPYCSTVPPAYHLNSKRQIRPALPRHSPPSSSDSSSDADSVPNYSRICSRVSTWYSSSSQHPSRSRITEIGCVSFSFGLWRNHPMLIDPVSRLV